MESLIEMEKRWEKQGNHLEKQKNLTAICRTVIKIGLKKKRLTEILAITPEKMERILKEVNSAS